MNAMQAAFDLLILTSAIDGNVDERELKIALDFLKSHFDNSFDASKELKILKNLTHAELEKRFHEAVEILHPELSIEGKTILLKYILETVTADNHIGNDERNALEVICRKWEIDFLEFLKIHKK